MTRFIILFTISSGISVMHGRPFLASFTFTSQAHTSQRWHYYGISATVTPLNSFPTPLRVRSRYSSSCRFAFSQVDWQMGDGRVRRWRVQSLVLPIAGPRWMSWSTTRPPRWRRTLEPSRTSKPHRYTDRACSGNVTTISLEQSARLDFSTQIHIQIIFCSRQSSPTRFAR